MSKASAIIDKLYYSAWGVGRIYFKVKDILNMKSYKSLLFTDNFYFNEITTKDEYVSIFKRDNKVIFKYVSKEVEVNKNDAISDLNTIINEGVQLYRIKVSPTDNNKLVPYEL